MKKWMQYVCLSAFIVGAPMLWAQNGELTGRITDNRGNTMGNVVIVITDASGGTQRVVSGPDGTFTVTTLTPGAYTVQVESPDGTKRPGSQSITITSGAPSQIEVTFDSAAERSSTTTGAVEIKAISPTLQTDSAEVSRQYGTQTVRSLPVIDRNHYELIGLMPGVTPPLVSLDRVQDPQRTRLYNVNGQPSYANVFYQDAAYGNEQFSGRVSRVAPNESIQALNVRTSNYNAEYGFAGGSWANTVTRPGTNRVHGSLFAFHTNEFFTSRNPLNVTNNPDPKFNVNQFGGSAGGPVIKDRMFFFVSYEGFMQRGDQLSFATVPTAAVRTGNFADFAPSGTIYDPRTGITSGAGRTPFPGGQIPVNRLNPLAQTLLGYVPLPNQSGFVNNLIANAPLYDSTHRFDGKIDHRFSERTVGYLRYGFTHGLVQRSSLLGPLGDAAQSGLRNHNAVANVSHNFGNTALVEFRMGYNRYRNLLTPFGDAAALNGALGGFGFANGLPEIQIAGLTGFGLPGNFPSKQVNNTYNPALNVIIHQGIHSLKAGAEYRNIQANGFDPGFFSSRGSFIFGPGATGLNTSSFAGSGFNTTANAFAAFLLGAPSQAGISSFADTPTWRQQQYAGYITDTVNLWQKLFLEFGVRYDAYSPLETRNAGGAAIFDPTTNTIGFNGQGNYDMAGNAKWDTNNIAPRVGFAISPFRRMAIRGGYGIHYFPLPFALSTVNQTAFGAQTGLTGGYGSIGFQTPVVPMVNPNGMAGNQPYYVGSPDAQTPYVQSYSLIVQTDLTKGFLLDLGYVGSSARHLPFETPLNIANPGAGAAGLPYASFGRTAQTYFRGTGLNNNYNSAQVNLTKRFSAGLALAASYTFSKALDYGFNLLDPFNVGGNYGRADWDRTHILAVSHVWRLPFGAGGSYFNRGVAANIVGGWELNGILRWATGTPYTVTADPLLCNCPGATSVPVGFSPSFAGGSFNGAANFDPTAFGTPQANAFGALSRNSTIGPDMFTYNMSLFRNFAVRENIKLELRGEVYNLTNSSNYGNPVSSLTAPGFGRAITTINGFGGRQFQLAGRLLF